MKYENYYTQNHSAVIFAISNAERDLLIIQHAKEQ